MRFSLLSYRMPELGGPDHGCFAKLPKYPPEAGRGFYHTTYQDDFCKKFEDHKFRPVTGRILNSTQTFSGLPSDFVPVDKVHISTKLINESYNKMPERKYNTEMQRTWTYHRDPAIYAVQNLGIDNAKRRPETKEVKFMTLPMKNKEEYQNMQHQAYVHCGHQISDITRKKLKEMAEIKKAKEGVA